MVAFTAGVLAGVFGCFLVLDNNPKLAKKLSSVKEIVEKKIEEKIKKDI